MSPFAIPLRPRDRLAIAMSQPTYWRLSDGTLAKAITMRDELNCRLDLAGQRLQFWEYEQALVLKELGLPTQGIGRYGVRRE